LLRHCAGLVGAEFAEFVPVFADQEHGAGGDFFIDTRPPFGGRGRILLDTSGDYHSISFTNARVNALPRSVGAKRNDVRSWTQTGDFRDAAADGDDPPVEERIRGGR